MTLYYKPKDIICKVYDVRYDSHGYPHFLIFLDGQWIQKSAKYFRPVFDA